MCCKFGKPHAEPPSCLAHTGFASGPSPDWKRTPCGGELRRREHQIASGEMMRPAMALAATTSGLARYTFPGPLRPGKLRLMAETVTSSAFMETPGPALMQAPHEGSTS